MKDIQSTYGGKNVTEPQLENVFRAPPAGGTLAPRATRGSTQFFTQWFDTPYPGGNANLTGNKPAVTGPGLAGTGFVWQRPAGEPGRRQRLVHGTPTLTWSGYGAPACTKTGCVDGSVPEGMNTLSCSVVTNAAPILDSGPVSETVNVDTQKPVVSYTGGRTYTVDETVDVECSASDPTPGSGLDSDTCADVSGPAYTFALGITGERDRHRCRRQHRLRLDDVHGRRHDPVARRTSSTRLRARDLTRGSTTTSTGAAARRTRRTRK